MDFQEQKKALLKKLPDTIKAKEVDEYIAKLQEEQLFWKQNSEH